MKLNFFESVIKMINLSLKVDSNSTSTIWYYQPPLPKGITKYKR